MNPVEEFLTEFGMDKVADASTIRTGIKDLGGSLARGLGSGAALAGGAALIGGAALGAAKLHSAVTKGRDFNKMMEFNPDLQDLHEQDPVMFNQMFSSLRNANRDYSSDPIIAGTYMRKLMDEPTLAGGALADAMRGDTSGQLAKDVSRTGMTAFTKGFTDKKKN